MPEVTLEIHNTRVAIHWADAPTLDAIDAVTSFHQGPPVAPRVSIDDPAHVWDGWTRFLRRPQTLPPWVPTGLLDRVVAVLRARGHPFQVEDRRVRPEGDVPRYLTPIPLYEYQTRAVDACLMPLRELRGQGVLDMPPRSGKTRILLEVHRQIDQPTLWVAPTRAIVEQTASVARCFFDPADVVVVSSSTLAAAGSARLAITTAAAAVDLPQSFYETRGALILDEFHHFLRNNSWGREITKRTPHVYYRFGATGTHFRSNGDDLAMQAVLSRVLYRMTSADLLALGRLVPTHLVFVPITGPRVRGAGTDFIGGFGRAGIHEHAVRNSYVAAAAVELHRSGRTVLVIVGTKVQGYQVQKLIEANMRPAPAGAEFRSVEFISTDRSPRIQKLLFASFIARAEVKILIGTSIVGEGVDLPPADALVWARGEKAAVSLVQGWYRVSTASPDKANAIVVDFADRHHRRLIEHSVERLHVASRDPLFRIAVLPDPEQFARWLSTVTAPAVI